MKTIYILLTKSDTILSRMVNLVTAAAYTHASISFEETLQPIYSSSRKNGKTIFPAGPCMERLKYGYYQRNPQIPCALFALAVEDEIYCAAKAEVESIIDNNANYHFNILGLILCQMNISYNRKNNFFCSQFVAEILDRSRAIQLPKKTSLMKPIDYAKLPDLRCCYKGCLGELLSERTQPVKEPSGLCKTVAFSLN